MNHLSIRWRLTLWYGIVLGIVLTGFGTAVYLIMGRELLAQQDAALSEELAEIVREVERATSWSGLRAELTRQFARHEGYEFQVATPSGEILFQSGRLGSVALPVQTLPAGFAQESHSLEALGKWRIQSRSAPGPDGRLIVQAAATLEPIETQMERLLAVLCLAGPLALAGAVAGGYLLARAALAPVDRMAAAADEITVSSLHRRLEVPHAGDELGRLGRTLNGMIARIERSFNDIQRFTADAAHELRTPLSVMRTEAEVALRSSRSPTEYRDVLQNMLEEIELLTRHAEQLLFLSRLDAGDVSQPQELLSFARVARDVAEEMRVVAQEKNLTLDLGRLENCAVRGNELQLRRLLLNLLDNAIKYTPAGGRVMVHMERSGESLHTIVEDTGIGISADHLPHVFKRFYRVDPARDQTTGGVGLGLAICQAVSQAHGGELRIESQFGRGTTCTLILPRAPAGADSMRSEPALS